ncbi:hypothetical protein NFI96_027242, partial [Prochilodus magdalenae]
DIERVTTKLYLIHKVNMDELYNKCSTVKPILRLKDDAEDEWKSSLFQVADQPNMPSIISLMLSILSTGYVERIISKMANNGVAAGTELLSAAGSNKKYTWKQKEQFLIKPVLRDSNDVLDTESSIEINRYTNTTIPLGLPE